MLPHIARLKLPLGSLLHRMAASSRIWMLMDCKGIPRSSLDWISLLCGRRQIALASKSTCLVAFVPIRNRSKTVARDDAKFQLQEFLQCRWQTTRQFLPGENSAGVSEFGDSYTAQDLVPVFTQIRSPRIKQ